MPVVSVIVPCYNHAEYLSQALDAVRTQTYQHWECIIVNDGSSDNTHEIVREYMRKDERFKYLEIANSGPAAARNYGIAEAAGEFILPLDGDDYISANYIEECVAEIVSKDIRLVYGKAEKFGLVNQSWNLKEYTFEKLLFENMIHCCGMYRKDDWNLAGGYDTNMKDGLEDWEFWINLLKTGGEVRRKDNVTFYWRIKENSRTRQINRWKEERLNRYVYCKHKELYESYFIDPLKIYKELSNLQKKQASIDARPFRFALWHSLNRYFKKSSFGQSR